MFRSFPFYHPQQDHTLSVFEDQFQVLSLLYLFEIHSHFFFYLWYSCPLPNHPLRIRQCFVPLFPLGNLCQFFETVFRGKNSICNHTPPPNFLKNTSAFYPPSSFSPPQTWGLLTSSLLGAYFFLKLLRFRENSCTACRQDLLFALFPLIPILSSPHKPHPLFASQSVPFKHRNPFVYSLVFLFWISFFAYQIFSLTPSSFFIREDVA